MSRIVQIETEAGLRNADAILSTPGLDGVYIGPTDLSRSLGGDYGADWTEGPVVEAIDELLELGARHEVSIGIYAVEPRYARLLADRGMSFIVLSGDIPLAMRAAQDSVSTFRTKN